jgi:hypothetical protein
MEGKKWGRKDGRKDGKKEVGEVVKMGRWKVGKWGSEGVVE